MQGRLTGGPVLARVESRCAACNASVEITVDGELSWRTTDAALAPVILEPSIDWSRFAGPNILHDY